MSTRGFEKLLGKTIVKVDTRAINVVYLYDSAGNEYELDSELGPIRIPVITLKKKKNARKEKDVSTDAGIWASS